MDVTKLLKYAFIMSVLIYGGVAVAVVGAPDWGRPMVPQAPGTPLLLGVFLFLSLSTWAAGMSVGRIASPPAFMAGASSQNPWPQTRFILSAALIEAGAIFGLALSFVAKDSRFALVTAAVSAILLLLSPASDRMDA